MAVILTRSWHSLVECEIILNIKSLNWKFQTATYSQVHLSADIFFAFVACLSTGEWVLSPIPECWPGRREAKPLHQCQLRPRLQCLPELLCCDRYNLTHATLIPERMRIAEAAGRRHLGGRFCRTHCSEHKYSVFSFVSAAKSLSRILSVEMWVWGDTLLTFLGFHFYI